MSEVELKASLSFKLGKKWPYNTEEPTIMDAIERTQEIARDES